MASVASLGGAVTALGKANPSASSAALVQVKQVLRRIPAVALAAAAPHARAGLREFLTAPSDLSLLQESSGLRTSAPASGAIFGMLGQMKETFETNLQTSKDEDAQAASQYENLKAAKTGEVTAATGKIATKKGELAQADSLAAESKTDLEATTNTLAADTEFLANLKKQCAAIDAEFDERTKARLEEVTAVGETIGILTSDEAQQSFSKSTSLLQARLESKRETSAREATAAFLRKQAQRLQSPRLSFLAARVQADAFAKIKENIDKMVVQLGNDGKAELDHKDGCVTDLKTNDKETTAKTKHKSDVETEIADLEAHLGVLAEEAKKLQTAVADMQIELKRAGEIREAENADFQTTVSDQRATQAIVKKALDRLAAFYSKKAFVQQGAAQTPPGSFKEMKKNGGATPVLALLENVIKDSADVEKDALEAENEAQEAYESFVKTTNKSIAEANEQLMNNKEQAGKETVKEVDDETDKRITSNDIDGLESMAATLHDGCDYDIEHFDERVAARNEETEALKQSKAIFSGAKSALMEVEKADRAGDDE